MLKFFIKNYLSKIKFYSFFLFLLFSFSIFLGYSLANKYPDKTEELIYKNLKAMIEPAKDYSSFQLFNFIFLKNIFVATVGILSGIIFGIIPILIIFFNGLILGIISYVFIGQFNTTVFIAGILPHGIFEIPAIIFSTASGLFIWRSFYRYILYGRSEFKDHLVLSIIFFTLIIIPMLIIAALIEVFITPHVLNQIIEFS